jgi:hypothetical protein
VLAWQALAQE